jgi:cytochrome c biogenesis protein CcmG, thiol:disulfide interchange protein DsbE
LMELKRRGVKIDAIAIRDRPEDVAAFLARNGDPYERIGSDTASRVQLAMGSSGVPETFVVDGKGVIRHQHIGDIRPENVDTILAELEKAK